MVNRVMLIGNLGRDPEVRSLESGAMVAKFSIATDEGYKGNDGNWVDRTEWHEIVVWRGMAERAQKSLKKGMMVYLEGKLTTRKWTDADGNDKYRTEVVGNYFRILNNRNGDSSAEHADATANSGAVHQEVEDSADDDLPF